MCLNKLKYLPEDVDCTLCTQYDRQVGCAGRRCPWLSERVEAGTMGYEEALLEAFPRGSSFRWRLFLLVDMFPGTLWNHEKHPCRMEARRSMDGVAPTSEYDAALYLLTSDSDVYGRCAGAFTETGIDFSRIRMRGVSAHAYTVIAAAKSIYSGSSQVTDEDLANPEIVDLDAFRLIIHALLIVRYGPEVLKITTKKAAWPAV